MTTVSIDIFACVHFREFAKIGNFARIYIRVFDINVYIWHNNSYFHETGIMQKYVQRELFYIHSILFSQGGPSSCAKGTF